MSRIICVSRGSLSRGRELAEQLARKLDYPVLSREDLIEEAIREGIQVGKLETSMMKPRAFTERLARERDHYLAFCTAYLCDRAMEGPLVYHGRTGHLLLPGIGHLMRVRVVAEGEYRIAATMRRLNVGREQARRYLEAVEEDRRNWARSMYGVSWEDASQYDVIVNVERMSVENAAAALVGMSQLPDFQMTPASRKAMEDLSLGAHARLRLARDARTARTGFTVRANHGVLTVTFLPHDADVARDIPQVLAGLEGVQDLRATMASTTLLWVQEAFDPGSETFQEVVQIAGKWNAAVELVRFTADEGGDASGASEGVLETEADTAVAGIEDDVEETADASGLKATLDELARVGKAGGGRYVRGERRSLVASCCGSVSYSLVVLGNLFLGKDQTARVRLTRELQESLASRLRVPVVTANELKSQYLFGRRDLVRLAGFLALVAGLYLLVMSNQEPILAFLFGSWSGGGWTTRLIVAVAVFVFVPIVAYSYGSVARSVMKLIKME
jgi:cytidylate kinase